MQSVHAGAHTPDELLSENGITGSSSSTKKKKMPTLSTGAEARTARPAETTESRGPPAEHFPQPAPERGHAPQRCVSAVRLASLHMLRASAMRSAPCRASRSSPSMGTPLRLCARAELLRAPATAPKPTLSLPICTPPPRAVFVAPDAMLRRLYSTGPKKPASAPTPASSSHSTNHVDLLSKYGMSIAWHDRD